MKIQQMAFLLVAITVFFSMIFLIYFSLSISSVRNSGTELQDEETKELVRKLSASPELAFTSSSDCSSCIDLDKALQISKIKDYEKLWNLNYLFIEIIRPSSTLPSDTECISSTTYPDNCNKITIIPEPENYATKTAFVTLVRWDPDINAPVGGYKYEFGRIHASPKTQDD